MVQAEKSGLQRLLQPFEGFSKEEEVSFRWDPANLRWAKSKTKMADDASMMITPLIGEPYLVRMRFFSPCNRPCSICARKSPFTKAITIAGLAGSPQLPTKEEIEDN